MDAGDEEVAVPPPVAASAAPPGPLARWFLLGLASVLVTKAVYAIEDGFEKLPLHWMWCPALGGVAVGVVGRVSPHTLGVGYDNIEHILAGDFTSTAVLLFVVFKFVSWSVALGRCSLMISAGLSAAISLFAFTM